MASGQDFMVVLLGALLGFGIGVVFAHNGSTGGTDIIAWIINKYKDVTLGHYYAYGEIARSSHLAYFHLPRLAGLVGFVVLFIMSIVIDYVINRTRHSGAISYLLAKYGDSCTGNCYTGDRGGNLCLDGKGWYSKQGISGRTGEEA